jgi:hypothetical protein
MRPRREPRPDLFGVDFKPADEVERGTSHHRPVRAASRSAGDDHLDGRAPIERHRHIKVAGDDQQGVVVRQHRCDLLGGCADVDEQRRLVGDQRCGGNTDRLLFGRRDEAARIVRQVLDAGGDDRAATGARQNPALAKLVEVTADRLGSNIEASRKIVDTHSAEGACERDYVMLAVTEELHERASQAGRRGVDDSGYPAF